MTSVGNLIAIVLCVGAFFGLVAYRTWQDRREERRQFAEEPRVSDETLARKTA